MDEHVYPLESSARGWKLEAVGPAYASAIREVQRRAKALGYWAFHCRRREAGRGSLSDGDVIVKLEVPGAEKDQLQGASACIVA